LFFINRLLSPIYRRLRSMLGLAVLRLVNDAPGIQQVQITLMHSEVRDKANRLQNYGFTSVPKAGAAAHYAAAAGHRGNVIVLVVDDPRYRKRNLADGEVAMYHHEGDYVLLKNGRIIEVMAGTKIKVTAPEIEAIAATKVKLDTPLVDCTGNLQIDGNLSVGGSLSVSGTTTLAGAVSMPGGATIGGIQFALHKHPGVTAGAAQTGTPV
jgi:phage baseplate assembly protein V